MTSLTAFVAEGHALMQALHDVAAADFTRATNCPPWTLSELVVHLAGSIRVGDGFSDAKAGTDPRTTADYYRRPERDTTAYRTDNVRQTQDAAAHVLATRTATEYLAATFDASRRTLTESDRRRIVVIDDVGAMRIEDWLITRVIALAAHGLDVALTLGRRPWTTSEALQLMRPVFVSLLEADPPPSWDDQHLLAVATGRATLTPTDRAVLGPHARRFPLLS
jgi:uncharacterized protein (TIGR03083 family)